MPLLALSLLAAAPWTVEVRPALEAPWSVEHAAAVDDAWAGFIARGEAGRGVFVARAPEAPRQVLALDAQPVTGLGFSVETREGDKHWLWRIDVEPAPTAHKVVALERTARAFSCARDADVCAWVDDRVLVVAKGELRTELTWDAARMHRRNRLRGDDSPEVSRSVALEDVETLGVSPDGTQVALQFHEVVVMVAADGASAGLAATDAWFAGSSVPDVHAALEAQVDAHVAWWNKREGCRTRLEGFSAPHTVELFIDQSSDPGADICGVETGPVSVGGSSDLGAPEWTWQALSCGFRHRSGATLSRSCPSDIGDGLSSPLALDADTLLFEEEWTTWWYAPPSRRKPFTPVSFQAREDGPQRWHIVTFGGEKPLVQRLNVRDALSSREELSLASGWHLFKSTADDGMRWVRFLRASGRKVAVAK